MPRITHASVKRNREWGEWVVQAYITVDGQRVRYPEADYHTDDREDAHDTREAMLRED
jgi:hypothetical protein